MGKLGAEQHRQLLISLFAAFPDSHWTVVDQIGEGDKVVTR
jgi:predicted ester cyclase